MKISEIRSKTKDELESDFADLKKEQFNLRFQKATGHLQKTSRVKQVRRIIARIKTVVSERLIQESKG